MRNARLTYAEGLHPTCLTPWPLLTPWRQGALACFYCASPVGQEVRASIFNGDFLLNVILTLLPIPVLLVVVAAIHFGLPPSRGAGDAHPSDPLDVDS